MRNKKLLYVLIPLIVVAVVLLAGIVFLKLNSKPEKIFTASINKIFDALEISEEEYKTVKGKMNFTANFESEEEEVQAVNDMLEKSSIGLNMEADTKNMVINENIDITFNDESFINATILLQDQKGYVYLPDWLDKYLQIPDEEFGYEELEESYSKMATLDQNALIETIKEELISSISSQELIQENATLVLDGQETKVTASTLSLKDAQMTTFYKELFGNLNKNEKFLVALGEYKEDVQSAIDEMLLDMKDAEDVALEITIYTKGFLNKFVGVTAKEINDYFGGEVVIQLLKHNNEKYEFAAYEEYDGEKEEAFNITVENKKESKNKGTATITMTVEEEQIVVTYNYETQGNQTTFVASTEIEGVALSISGNAVEEGKNVKGNFVISIQEETFGKVNLNCAYDFTYDVEIQKVDVKNAVLIDELSQEDQEELMTNFENSAVYQLIEQSGMLYSSLGLLNDEPEVTYGGFSVKYAVPDDFEASSHNSEDYKMYMDDDFNSVNVMINYDSVDKYMKDLEDSYILTSEFYENQKISETKTYTVNGKEYNFRTITYNDEYSSYVDLYFAYELDDEYCYVVEVESENGKISMDTIKNFLDVTIEKANMFSDINVNVDGPINLDTAV